MAKKEIYVEDNLVSKESGLKKVWYHKGSSSNEKSYKKQWNRYLKTGLRKNYRNQFDRSSFRDRTYLNATSSSFYYDFAFDNRKTFFTILLLFIGMFIVIMIDDVDVDNVNPLESFINILKSISDSGHDLKEAGLRFVKSFTTWSEPSGLNQFNLLEKIFDIELNFKTPVLGLIDSVCQSLMAIWYFLKSIFGLIIDVFRILMGVY